MTWPSFTTQCCAKGRWMREGGREMHAGPPSPPSSLKAGDLQPYLPILSLLGPQREQQRKERMKMLFVLGKSTCLLNKYLPKSLAAL